MISLFIFFFTSLAFGSLEDNFGLGGSSTGRAGNVLTDADQSYSALYNPALLAATPQSSAVFSTLSIASEYAPLTSVLVDSPKYRTGIDQGRETRDDIQIAHHSELQWALGLVKPWYVAWARRQAGIGVVLSGPYGKVRSLSASTPYDFASLRYGNSDRQFKVTLGTAAEIIHDTLFLGVGFTIFMSSNGVAESTLISENPTSRLAVEQGISSAANIGLYLKSDLLKSALVFHQAIDPSFEQRLKGSVQVGTSSFLSQPLVLRTSLYYEPAKLALEIQQAFGASVFYIGAQAEFWSGYRPPFLVTETQSASGAILRTEVLQIPLRNTLNPRVAWQYFIGKGFDISLGYMYRPSPLTQLGGPENLLDTEAHIGGMVLSHNFPNSLFSPFQWGIYSQYHWFSSRAVVKGNGEFIGAPGYEVSGHALASGIYVQAGL